MTKLTYAEQLKHPNWQRKRLEMLQAADWTCTCCSGKDSTLHVHHKQYFKGRMAWEYAADELDVLCESCHEYHHNVDEVLKAVLSRATYIPVPPASIAAGLLAGYLHGAGELDEAATEAAHGIAPTHFYLGLLSHVLSVQGREGIRKFLDAVDRSLCGAEVDELLAWLDRPTSTEIPEE